MPLRLCDCLALFNKKFTLAYPLPFPQLLASLSKIEGGRDEEPDESQMLTVNEAR